MSAATTTDSDKSLEVAQLETERLPLSDNPPKKSKLNANHKRFIKARLSGKSQTQAYMDAYEIDKKKRDYAGMAAARLMIGNDRVREAINERMDQATAEATDSLTLAMSEAADTVIEIMQDGSKEDGVRLRAAEYLIDRGLGKPRTNLNVDGSIARDINIVMNLPEGGTIDDLL